MLYYILTFQLACELMWVFCRKIDTHIVIGIIWSLKILSSQNGKVLFEKIDTFNVHDTITKSCFILFDKLLDFTGVNAFVIHGTISYFQGSQSRFFINTLEVFLIRLLEYYQEKFEYQRLVLLKLWLYLSGISTTATILTAMFIPAFCHVIFALELFRMHFSFNGRLVSPVSLSFNFFLKKYSGSASETKRNY